MALLWSENLRTGHAVIDRQHQDICRMVREFKTGLDSGGSHEVLNAKLESLNRYVIEHFSTEELIMQSKKYPGYKKHKVRHGEFIANLLGIIQDIKQGKQRIETKLVQEYEIWLQKHIEDEDLALAAWLKEQNVR